MIKQFYSNIKDNEIIISSFLMLLLMLFILSLIVTGCDLFEREEDPSLTIADVNELKDLHVTYGSELSQVISDLNDKRNKAEVKLDDGSTAKAGIAWDKEGAAQDYQPETPGSYEFTGTAEYNNSIIDVKINVINIYQLIFDLGLDKADQGSEVELEKIKLKNMKDDDYNYDGQVINLSLKNAHQDTYFPEESAVLDEEGENTSIILKIAEAQKSEAQKAEKLIVLAEYKEIVAEGKIAIQQVVGEIIIESP